jgi:hypothetical protein
MRNTEQQFNSLATEFETLAVAMRGCESPDRRVVLMQRMRVVIEEIDEQIFSSLNQDTGKLTAKSHQ